MQHAAVAVAPRCADGVNNFDIPFHEISLPLPAVLVFVPTNSNSCFHESCRSFPRIRFPASIKSGIHPHRFKFLFSRILSFLPTNSDSRFHRFGCSFPRIQIPAFTNSNSRFHEFTFSLPRISTFAFTDSDIPPHECGETKKTSFCGDVFLYRFSFKWRCLADSNRRGRFCRPLTKPLIQGTIP